MKKLLFAAALFASPCAYATRQGSELQYLQSLNGSPAYLGQLTGTTLQTLGSIQAGAQLLIRCDVAAYILPGTTVTATNGVYLDAGEKFYLLLKTSETALAMLPVSGTATCKVWRME